jgi:hypothetical protein
VRRVLLLALVAGCGHTTLDGRSWRGVEGAFRIGTLGPGWHRVDGDADLSLFNPTFDAAIMANVECKKERDAPLTVLANTLLIGFEDRRILREERVRMAGREALHQEIAAKLDGAALRLDTYVLKKDECVYDLVYLAPPAGYARGRADFDVFVAGFDTRPSGRQLARGGGR